MSGVEKIAQKILDDASKESSAIIEQAEQKAAELAKKASAAADRKASQIIEAAKAEAVEVKKRRQSVCDLELRKNILAAKRSVIEAAFVKAEGDIANAPQEKYQQIMLKMLVECAQVGDGAIIVAEADKNKLDDSFVAAAVSALKAKGVDRKIAISNDKRHIANGFVYVADGLEYNCSLESVLRQLRHDTETEVSKILFND